jgi:hypothetical protein
MSYGSYEGVITVSTQLPNVEDTARLELRVGDWLVDPSRNEVRRNGQSVHLEPKAIEVLEFLVQHADEVLGREALLSAIWHGIVVGDDALTQTIIKLRRALGDDAHRPKYIETRAVQKPSQAPVESKTALFKRGDPSRSILFSMVASRFPLQYLIAALALWLNRQQQDVIDYYYHRLSA